MKIQARNLKAEMAVLENICFVLFGYDLVSVFTFWIKIFSVNKGNLIFLSGRVSLFQKEPALVACDLDIQGSEWDKGSLA